MRLARQLSLSSLIYAAPVLAMWLYYTVTGAPLGPSTALSADTESVFRSFSAWGLSVCIVAIGLLEFVLGLYDHKWDWNERKLDLACFLIPRFITRPLTAWFGLTMLPLVAPSLKNTFNWVPFFWGLVIIAIADDLTQYWYHRLHHEIPWLWRFHRTHHSAPYMGMSMAGRQNLLYTIFFSQTWVTVTLTYVGLGAPALLVLALKSIITTFAHSSIRWDEPFYRHRWLNPIAWVMERVISTPATHHAHHAAVNDGVGFYKGNFGNMFFLWDLLFGTALITRQYPAQYGITHYEGDEWYAQFLWPILKSSVPNSELAHNGPEVREDD